MNETTTSSNNNEEYDYIFGFGSIINTSTHAPWLESDADDRHNDGSTVATSLPGQRATLLASFGFRRGWNFRSATGFTALGVVKTTIQSEATPINGVVFRVTRRMLLTGFDRREVGYDRVEIPRNQIKFHSPPDNGNSNDKKTTNTLSIRPHEQIWVYVPQAASLAAADEDHPILQSYVDTVLQGCLEWGGTDMCHEFVTTTGDWSPYFLNDTPSSRRPWLFRKQYTAIDEVLRQHTDKTYFAERRHPEEFASAFLIKMMRGAWNVPRRNAVFTGRNAALGQIHARLVQQHQQQTQSSSNSSIAKLEVAGMGGVGKSQICTEYCYRYFPSYFGLVIWLSAQSAESVASGYRQLMADTTGMDVKDKDTDEVVAEVKARLYRNKVPWLLVFDNLEDKSLLDKFVPAGGSGHVLVTTRLVDNNAELGQEQTFVLGCFQPEESVELLCRAAGSDNIGCHQHVEAAHKLANHLGHLPLALGMAAAYMRRCDVECSEYLARYLKSEQSGHALMLGNEAVSSSLQLSLDAIKKENMAAWEALRLLGWLGPDVVTKKLLRSLLVAKQERATQDETNQRHLSNPTSAQFIRAIYAMPMAVGFSLLLWLATKGNFDSRQSRFASSVLVGTLTAASASVVTAFCMRQVSIRVETKEEPNEPNPASVPRGNCYVDVFEATDQIWTISKSFSLLVVKEGQGSMHRLLAQSLRSSQSKAEGRRNIEICLQAVLKLWNFKPTQIDSWEDAVHLLEHVKVVVNHIVERNDVGMRLETAFLSREAGLLSAMALNRFQEAQLSLEQSLQILDGFREDITRAVDARASTLFELGKVYRYQGQLDLAEESLKKALEIRKRQARREESAQNCIAATLHELGVVEVKKHNLNSAAAFLEEALDLRRRFQMDSPTEENEADSASTLHQLAAIHVARRPPSLDVAELLLNEALTMSMQIGQRAATLKQLARVAIRRGEFQVAEKCLRQALELYIELYGENTLHINVAAVQFQQGILAFQREQLEQAWLCFSECLRARRHVYAYAQGNHLEVSTVLHELGCVAQAQKRFAKAMEMFTAEKAILDQLDDNSSNQQRLFQARLTNLSWLKKCAKAEGDDVAARKFTADRANLKKRAREKTAADGDLKAEHPDTTSLLRRALQCRLVARQYAISDSDSNRNQLSASLGTLWREIGRRPQCPTSLRDAVLQFYKHVTESLENANKRTLLFEACDDLRDILRDFGVQVQDSVKYKQ